MGSTSPLSIRIEDEQTEGWTIHLEGELDMAGAPQLLAMLDTCKPVVVDLSKVTFMDSSGLAALIGVSGKCENLRLVPGPERVQKIFEMTHTTDRFTWVGT